MSDARALAPEPAAESGFFWFATGVLCWFAAWGLQSVLVTWLVTGVLEETPRRVGLAQTASMLPAVFLLLYGGAAADRRDPRGWLLRLHLVAVVPALVLAVCVATDRLSYPLVIGYALCAGAISAFVMPTRDTLLSRVAGPGGLMRAVTTLTAVQFGAQAAGNLSGGLARWVGTAPMLVVQAALLVVSVLLLARVSEGPAPARAAGAPSTLRDIRDGLAIVLRTPRLRIPALLMSLVGLFFVGPFFVVYPLLVRDYYHGDVSQISVLLMLFPLGTILGSLALNALGGLTRKGRSALIALLVCSAALAVVGLGVPFEAAVALTLVWGLAASVFINACRTLFQLAAPAQQRARVLAVYQLGFLSAGPLGAFLTGQAVEMVGPLATIRLFAAAMALVVTGLALASDATRMD